MKKECRISSFIFLFVLCFNIFSQDYKQDSLAVRAILDSNGLDTVTVTSVSKVGNNRIDTLIIASKNLSKLPAVIGTIAKLKYIDLHDNLLKTLPPEIGSLVDVVFMDLRQNEIEALPATIGNLAALNRLYVSTNSLKSLPAEIGQLNSLDRLYLEMNQITSLPAQIGNLTNLTLLWVHLNKIAAIPGEIGGLVKLKTFFIGNNNITEIPPEIGKLSALTSLSLNNNKLVTLPDSIALLKPSSGGLDLGYNNLDTNKISKTVLAWADQYDPDWRGTQTIGIKNLILDKISNEFSIVYYPKTVKLNFNLPDACRIKIDLYDTHGKLLYTLLNDYQSKGLHSVSIDKNSFGSNIYYIRFSAMGYGAFSRAVVQE